MTRASTNFNPLLNVGAGNGVASKNIVKTAAINDIGHVMIWRKPMERLVPRARRRIRRLAMSDLAVTIGAWSGLVGVSKNTV